MTFSTFAPIDGGAGVNVVVGVAVGVGVVVFVGVGVEVAAFVGVGVRLGWLATDAGISTALPGCAEEGWLGVGLPMGEAWRSVTAARAGKANTMKTVRSPLERLGAVNRGGCASELLRL